MLINTKPSSVNQLLQLTFNLRLGCNNQSKKSVNCLQDIILEYWHQRNYQKSHFRSQPKIYVVEEAASLTFPDKEVTA